MENEKLEFRHDPPCPGCGEWMSACAECGANYCDEEDCPERAAVGEVTDPDGNVMVYCSHDCAMRDQLADCATRVVS